MLVEKSYDTGELVLNYAEGSPSGPPLVLLHGGTGRWQMFMPILPFVLPRWHVYALDARGHGKTGRVPGRYRLADLTRDVEIFLKEVVQEPCVVYGVSQGGFQALKLAGDFEDAFTAIILGDSGIMLEDFYKWLLRGNDDLKGIRKYLDRDRDVYQIARGLTDGVLTPSALRRAKWYSQLSGELCDEWIKLADEEYFWEWHKGYDPEEALRSIKVPVLLFQGDPELGGLMTDADVEKACSILEEVSVVKLNGVGHGQFLESLEAVVQPLIAFLESLR